MIPVQAPSQCWPTCSADLQGLYQKALWLLHIRMEAGGYTRSLQLRAFIQSSLAMGLGTHPHAFARETSVPMRASVRNLPFSTVHS
eukprot:2310233-Amphidinium_carterae.1